MKHILMLKKNIFSSSLPFSLIMFSSGVAMVPRILKTPFASALSKQKAQRAHSPVKLRTYKLSGFKYDAKDRDFSINVFNLPEITSPESLRDIIACHKKLQRPLIILADKTRDQGLKELIYLQDHHSLITLAQAGGKSATQEDIALTHGAHNLLRMRGIPCSSISCYRVNNHEDEKSLQELTFRYAPECKHSLKTLFKNGLSTIMIFPEN